MRLMFNIIMMILCIILVKVITNQEPTVGESLILGVLASVLTNQEKILKGGKR